MTAAYLSKPEITISDSHGIYELPHKVIILTDPMQTAEADDSRAYDFLHTRALPMPANAHFEFDAIRVAKAFAHAINLKDQIPEELRLLIWPKGRNHEAVTVCLTRSVSFHASVVQQ